MKLDKFTQSYLVCALWSSTDNDGDPLDCSYMIEDLSSEALFRCVLDCTKFQLENANLLEGIDPSDAGHDFWLTRNRHGAGFWDGDYKKEQGDALTKAAHAFGEIDLYVGDDGKLYI